MIRDYHGATSRGWVGWIGESRSIQVIDLFWNYWREFSVYYGWKAMGEHGLDVESGFAREDILLRRAAVYGKGEHVPIEYVQ